MKQIPIISNLQIIFLWNKILYIITNKLYLQSSQVGQWESHFFCFCISENKKNNECSLEEYDGQEI